MSTFVENIPMIIAILIVCIYFLIGLLFAKNNKFDLKSFASMGYVTFLVILMILFYLPLQNLIERTARDVTSFKYGKMEIYLSLPVVAINHLKNDILLDAVESEKIILQDKTCKPEVLESLLLLMRFETDHLKLKSDTLKLRDQPCNHLLKKIQCYEEVIKKVKEKIIPLIKEKRFDIAFEEYHELKKVWQNTIFQNVPQCQTIDALLQTGIGNLELSAKILKSAIDKFPNDISLLHYYGGLFMGEGDLISAIHSTKRAMVILNNKFDEYCQNHAEIPLLSYKKLLTITEPDKMMKAAEKARRIVPDNYPKPSYYEKNLVEKATVYWKNRLAYLLSLARVDEDYARILANDLTEYISDMPNKNCEYLDVIGFVNLVFAKNKEEIIKSKSFFEQAKAIAESSSKKDENLIARISSHASLVKKILEN